MKSSLLFLALLALIPIAANADRAAHHETMHGKAEAGHSGATRHAHGIGKPGNPKKASRTVQVLMSDDMKFTPATIDVKRGETVRFVVRNAGRTKHEMIIGTMEELKQHAELMRRMPGMEHEEPNQVTLDPGKHGDLVWHFTKAGTVDFACLQPGHFEAGMKGAISVK